MKEFKVGDMIEIAESHNMEEYFKAEEKGVILNVFEDYVIADLNNQNNNRVYKHGLFAISKKNIRLYIEEKPRFHDAQVGDEVYCRRLGHGIIIEIDFPSNWPIDCYFENYGECCYTVCGKLYEEDTEPILFYRKGEEKYLTERPEYEIDWSKVTMGTKVFTYLKKEDMNDPSWNKDEDIKIFMGYFPDIEYNFWVFDKETASGYKYCKIAESCKPEWRK